MKHPSNDIEREGERRAGPVECLQPITTLATSDIPIYGDMKVKTIVCVTFMISFMKWPDCVFSNHVIFYI